MRLQDVNISEEKYSGHRNKLSYLSKSLFFITIFDILLWKLNTVLIFCLKACLRVEKDLWVLVSERFLCNRNITE